MSEWYPCEHCGANRENLAACNNPDCQDYARPAMPTFEKLKEVKAQIEASIADKKPLYAQAQNCKFPVVFCLSCSGDTFTEQARPIIQEYKGTHFIISTNVMVCTKCGWYTCNDRQVDELTSHVKKVSFFNQVYGLLVSIGGASECWRDSFLSAHTDSKFGGCDEWRFQGHLGFGGKYRSKTNTVDCYPEDETPDRRTVIVSLNTELAKLKQ